MSNNRFSTTARMPVFFSFPGLPDDERERANIVVDIVFDYVPGVPEQKWSAELCLVNATLISGDGLDLADSDVKDRAQAWLDDEGYDACCQLAEAVPA